MFNITFNASNIEMTDAIRAYFEKKLETLVKLVEVPSTDDICEVRIRREAPDHHKQGGDIYHVDVTITSQGHMYRADADTSDMYAAIDEVKDDLERLIREQQSSWRESQRRGGLEAKEMLHEDA